jgi:hypothetical protein
MCIGILSVTIGGPLMRKTLRSDRNCWRAEAVMMMMMMMLFIVLFQKQIPYTFGKGTYFMTSTHYGGL